MENSEQLGRGVTTKPGGPLPGLESSAKSTFSPDLHNHANYSKRNQTF